MTNNPTALRYARLRAEPATLPGGVPSVGVASATFGDATVEIAAADGDGVRIPRFDVVAYTGGPMRPRVTPPLPHPVVVDLAGLDIPGGQVPMLRDHDFGRHVGHTEAVRVTNGELHASGLVSGGGPDAVEVLAASGRQFKWKLSIGADLDLRAMDFVPANSLVQVNGRRVAGPVFVSRRSVLNEISFLTRGADVNTVARIAASAAEGSDMDFEQWLTESGFDKAALNDKQIAKLQAQYDAEQDNGGQPSTPPPPATTTAPSAATPELAPQAASLAAEAVAELQTEQVRLVKLQAACSGHADIFEKAVAGNWDVERAKDAVDLAKLRANRPQAPHGIVRDNTLNSAVLEAAVATAGGLNGIDKQFDEQTLDAADRRFHGRIGLQEVIMEAAAANGYSGQGYGAVKNDLRGVMQAAFGRMRAAGFSTLSLPGILSNSANKFLLAGFMNVEQTWRTISAIRNVSDFKQITSYRLTGAFQYEKVGPGGELKHGSVDEESFTNKADTYGIMFAVTRQDIINDDLGAMTAIPQRIGRGAALKINDVFWTVFANISFTGAHLSASSPLGIDGLTSVETKFLDKTDPDGKPLAIAPRTLLVPNALKAKAAQLMSSMEYRDTTANSKTPTSNPHAGKFTPVASSYLGNAAYGNSTTDWWLLANPNDVAVIETAFLNGKQEPTVETADADFNTLGVQMRGYHDFGVAAQDVRGGVKAEAT